MILMLELVWKFDMYTHQICFVRLSHMSVVSDCLAAARARPFHLVYQ